ncbi:hypothetical protein JCM6882_000473 [Rhodosporidiobolus microsporus]
MQTERYQRSRDYGYPPDTDPRYHHQPPADDRNPFSTPRPTPTSSRDYPPEADSTTQLSNWDDAGLASPPARRRKNKWRCILITAVVVLSVSAIGVGVGLWQWKKHERESEGDGA